MSPSCILFKPICQLNLHSLFIVAVEKWGVEKEGKWDEVESEIKERPGKTEHTRIKKLHFVDKETESLRETRLT